MSRLYVHILLFLFLVFAAPVAKAQSVVSPLVTAQWLLENPAGTKRVLLDLRDRRSFATGHIPGSVHTDYGRDGWRVTIRKIPGLLPTSGVAFDQLVRKIGQLGIGNDSHVILVAPGWSAGDMGMATRLYWSFKVLGHDRVSILDGGFVAWQGLRKADGKTPLNLLKTGIEKNRAQTFTPALRPDMLMNMAAVKTARANGQTALDARPTMQYLGLQQSGAVLGAGTLPGAVSLPGQWVTENSGGLFRSPDALNKLLDARGQKVGDQMFVFCNTGHWASLIWFVASELLGNKKVRMYDGSLADWTARNNQPLERKIRLN
jgi:thiosulfate/3-mercaptopyruvate sulfurtransferase